MKTVCRACHGDDWINDFYQGFDKAVEEYNEVYFKPAKAKIDDLYGKQLLDKTDYFDEHLEVQFYALWHHEGRRARMGTMMMAPDYAWWHGFYECKVGILPLNSTKACRPIFYFPISNFRKSVPVKPRKLHGKSPPPLGG